MPEVWARLAAADRTQTLIRLDPDHQSQHSGFLINGTDNDCVFKRAALALNLSGCGSVNMLLFIHSERENISSYFFKFFFEATSKGANQRHCTMNNSRNVLCGIIFGFF